MLPTGIFVRTDLDGLVSSLPDRLVAQGPPRLTIDLGPEGADPEEQQALGLSQWSNDWCHIEITGPEELTALVVQSFARHKPVYEVLSCHFRPEAGEYGYALFREGVPMETFQSRGPTIEAVNFISELRRVPLQDLLRSSVFMIDSMSQFGINPSSRPMAEIRKVMFYVNLPVRELSGRRCWAQFPRDDLM